MDTASYLLMRGIATVQNVALRLALELLISSAGVDDNRAVDEAFNLYCRLLEY